MSLIQIGFELQGLFYKHGLQNISTHASVLLFKDPMSAIDIYVLEQTLDDMRQQQRITLKDVDDWLTHIRA